MSRAGPRPRSVTPWGFPRLINGCSCTGHAHGCVARSKSISRAHDPAEMRDGAIVAKAQDLTCQELVELVTDYLEGTLAPAERARFDAHIASCTNCRRYLDQMRRTIAPLPRLTEETIQPEARETLLQAFRKWKAG